MPLIAPYVPTRFGGVIDATATKPKTALSGSQLGAATMLNTLAKITAALSGTQKQSGTLGAKITDPVTTVSDTRPPVIVTPTAALSGAQQQSGVMGATVAKASTAMTSVQQPAGTISATAPKVASTGVGVMGSFVVRDPATGFLMLDGQRYRYAGNNGEFGGLSESTTTYGEPTDVDGLHTMSHTAIDAYFTAAIAMNAKVVRTFQCEMIGKTNSVQPTLGNFNAAALEGFDYALTKLQAAGMKVTCSLVDNNQYFPGSKFTYCTWNGVTPDSHATQFFSNTTIINSYKAHISFVLNHVNIYTGIKYKDDPTILAWETGNELSFEGAAKTTAVQTWTDTIAQHIKVTEGAKQLLIDGWMGIVGPDGTIDSTVLSNPYLDIFYEHSYDQFRTPLNMARAGAICHSYGKGFLVSEYTWTNKDVNGFNISTWTLPQMIAGLEISPWVDGDQFWSLHPAGMTHGGGFMMHYPADNSNTSLAAGDMATRAAQLVTHATDNPNSPSRASALVDTFTTQDTSKWTFRGTASVTGGQLRIPGGPSLPGVVSAKKYSLLEEEILVELVQVNPSSGQSFTGFGVTLDPNDWQNSFTINVFNSSNQISFRQTAAGSVSEALITYSATNHRWLRIRQVVKKTLTNTDAGTIYWDTSPDGIRWTNQRNITEGIALHVVYVAMTCTPWGTDATPGTAIFDNFNNPPPPTPTLVPPVKHPNYGSLLQV